MTTQAVRPQTSRLHEATTECAAAGFNVYQTSDTRGSPPISYTAGEPRYGMLSADTNAGLRLPQSRPLNLDAYNSGCVNPQGCVSNPADGFTCSGPLQKPSMFLESLYQDLNAPFDPAKLEYNPPAYMMGIKNGTANSVTGWAKTATGLAWMGAGNVQPCEK